MKNREITFKINESECLIIKIENMDEVHCCYEVPIFLKKDEKEILLTNDSLRYNLENLKNQLIKALNNTLQLHESLKKNDIGLLLNQDLQQIPGLYYKKFNKSSYWIGQDILLWNDMHALWLYNNTDGDIIIEVTPIYPKKEYNLPNHINTPYEEWIKTYTPYLIRTISKEKALEWLLQIDRILNQIAENVRAFESEA